MKRWLVFLFLGLVLLLGFVLYWRSNELSNREATRNITPESTSIGSPNLRLLSSPIDTTFRLGTTYAIKWEQTDLLRWGDEIIICLVGFTGDNKEIAAGKSWNESLCTYRGGNTLGSYLVAKTKLSDGNYSWQIPTDIYERFVEKPQNFKLRLLVFDNLPSEGRTEWGGVVGWSESGSFAFKKWF